MIKEFVDKFTKLEEGFSKAFGDTLEPAEDTSLTDEKGESVQPKIGLFEGYENSDDDKDDMVDLW